MCHCLSFVCCQPFNKMFVFIGKFLAATSHHGGFSHKLAIDKLSLPVRQTHSVSLSVSVCGPGCHIRMMVGLVSNQLLTQCVCLSVCLCLSLFLSVFLSFCLCVCLFVCLSLSLSVCLSVCLSLSLTLCVWSRVPYQNVVVGLVSNQLLIQCVCALLLRGTKNSVAAEQGIIAVNHTASRSSAADGSHDNVDDTNLLTSTPPLPGL